MSKIQKEVEELETCKENDLIKGEMKGLKEFTLSTLEELD